MRGEQMARPNSHNEVLHAHIPKTFFGFEFLTTAKQMTEVFWLEILRCVEL
jgi:hypothetical protein